MKLPLIVFILLLSHTPFLSKAQTLQYFYGNYVYDLYPDTSADFSSMTASWKLNNFAGTAAMTKTCQLTASETVPMFGGTSLNDNPDSTGVPHHIDKEYSSLPTHQSVYYQVEVMVISSINAGLQIYIDSSQNFLVYPRNYIGSDTMITCDSSSYVAVTIIGSATHSASTLTFKVRSPANYLFGIRDVQISFSPDPVSASASNCMVIQTATNRVTSAGICACGSDEHYSSTTSLCESCDPSCSSCFGPITTDCFGCAEGSVYDATSQSCNTCTDGCLLCSGPGIDECLQCSAFIYQNNSCIVGCSSPYQQRGTTQYCDPMCSGSTPYFYESDSQCYATCDTGVVKDLFICESASSGTGSAGGSGTGVSTSTLSASEQSTIKTTTQTASSVSDVTSTLGKAISIINFSNPGAIFMASFVEMIRYIKYLRIDYPEKLQYSLDLQLDLPIQIIPDPPDSLNNYLVSAPIPDNFEGDYSSASFFWNFWNDLITLAALGFVIVLVLFIKPCTGKYKRIHSFMTEAHQALLWNFSLPYFASSFADIVLFSSFELQTAEYSVTTGLSTFSLVLCCAFNLLAIITFIKMVQTVQTHYYQVVKTLNSSAKRMTQKRLSSYQVVYECCKKKSFFQQAFMPIFVGRIYLFVVVIAYLYNYPVMQALIIMILSLLMLLYLFITRPIDGWVDMANYILQELVTLLVLLCTLILAGLDPSDPSNNTIRDNLADVIINSNFAFCGISLVYLVIQLVPLLKKGFGPLIKYLRKSKPNKNMEEGKLKIQQVPRLNHSPNTSIDPLRDIEPVVGVHGVFENSSPQANFAKRAVRARGYSRSPLHVHNAVNY